VDTTTLVGVGPDNLVSDCARALVADNPFRCAIRSILEARTGATSNEGKIALNSLDERTSAGPGKVPIIGISALVRHNNPDRTSKIICDCA
jgi:hypothetical protein